MIFEIKKRITPDEVDLLYERLNNLIEDERVDVIDLKIPNIIEEKYFTVTPLLIQLVSTWSHNPKSGCLITDILISGPDQIFKDWSVSNLHFVAVLLCWNKKILSIEGGNIRLRFKKHIDERLESMKNLQAISGNDALFTCVDDYNDELGLLKHFYSRDKSLLNKGDIAKSYFTNSVLKNVIKFSFTAMPAIQTISQQCMTIIYELMENTHYWARTSFDNQKVIYPSVRGLFVKFHRYNEGTLKRGISNNRFFNSYFSNSGFKANPQGELYFLEFTIFDCGDGLVKRNSNKDSTEFSSKQKVNFVKRCLWKGFSSEKGLSYYERGNGLFLICTILNNQGFLRIRTDTVDLFRDFKSNSFDSELKLFEEGAHTDYTTLKLFDWSTGDEEEFLTKTHVKGTSISIVFPLEYSPYIQNIEVANNQSSLFNE